MPPRDLEAWMWAEACEALVRAERLRQQFFRLGAPGARPVWEPPVDIFEKPEALWIFVALPGVDGAEIEVSVEHGVLIIAGERPSSPALQRGAAIHRMEIPWGRFERRIALPPERFELVRSDFAHGCLTLTLRKPRSGPDGT